MQFDLSAEFPGNGANHAVILLATLLGLTDAEVLAAADKISRRLAAGNIAVIVGPASALCDRLDPNAPDGLYSRRSETLSRDQNATLAAAIRLPRGLWREAHRVNLGLWVLRGGAAPGQVSIADLTGAPFAPPILAQDIDGVLGASTDIELTYLRTVHYAEVWTEDTVVPLGWTAATARTDRDADHYDTVIAAYDRCAEPLSGYQIAHIIRSDEDHFPSRSLAELISAGQARLFAGARIRDDHCDPSGAVPVFTPGERCPTARMDRLIEAEHYARAMRTEPGDVVFAVAPHPWACVDVTGGALVAFPCRVLRLEVASSTIGPHTLAAVINSADGTEWKTWRIPTLRRTQVDPLDSALAEIEHYTDLLRHRISAASTLTSELIEGVAAGAVSLAPDDAPAATLSVSHKKAD
ncbi:MAG: hypothetical protein LBB54_05390 [Cellulomonadaceae bacterium]|nr:hypothetical protein [Cellulomonadaceae bacterium]